MPVSRKEDPQSSAQSDRTPGSSDHLIPHANRLLVMTAKGTWHAFKFLGGVAIRIPGWFVRANKRAIDRDRRDPTANRPR